VEKKVKEIVEDEPKKIVLEKRDTETPQELSFLLILIGRPAQWSISLWSCLIQFHRCLLFLLHCTMKGGEEQLKPHITKCSKYDNRTRPIGGKIHRLNFEVYTKRL